MPSVWFGGILDCTPTAEKQVAACRHRADGASVLPVARLKYEAFAFYCYSAVRQTDSRQLKVYRSSRVRDLFLRAPLQCLVTEGYITSSQGASAESRTFIYS